jgi:DNA polymerase III subunit delta'
MTMENWGLLGHDWAVDLLRNQVRKGNVEHSYLLAGAPGIGRTTLALRFTQVLNCENPPQPGEACFSCNNCIQIEKQQFSDLLVVQSENEGAPLKIENIREAMHWLTLAPYQGKYRVAVFRRFHEANDQSKNALLKTLEEPSQRALLFLVADTPDQLLPTITSRCEILRLRTPSVKDLQEYLLQNGSDPEEAELLAHISAGRPGYALSLKNSPDFLMQREVWLNDLMKLLPANRVKRFAYAEKLSKTRFPKKKGRDTEEDDENEVSVELSNIPRQVLETWGSFWRDVMIAASGSHVPLVNIDQLNTVQALGDRLGFSRAKLIVVDIEKSIDRMDRFVNIRLLLEVLLLKLPVIPEFGK